MVLSGNQGQVMIDGEWPSEPCSIGEIVGVAIVGGVVKFVKLVQLVKFLAGGGRVVMPQAILRGSCE